MNKSRSLYHRVVLTVSLLCTSAIVLIIILFLAILDKPERVRPSSIYVHNMFLAITIGLLILLYTLVYLYIRKLFKPMHALKSGVESVAQGNFDVQIPIKTKDEFGQLSKSFNKMATEIQSMVKYKDQLLSDVSHELRTPITRMRLAAEMMEESKQRESMISDLREMSHLVENLLESNRLNYGVSSLNKQSFDLTALLTSLVHEQRELPPGVKFEPPEVYMIDADQSLIKTLFRNLIDNAIKYSSNQAAPVSIKIQRKQKLIMVIIEDHGIGIPESSLEHIFEPFYRVEQSRSKRTGGYGLGLNIAKKVVEAHGGEIRIKNNPSSGVSAIVELPTT